MCYMDSLLISNVFVLTQAPISTKLASTLLEPSTHLGIIHIAIVTQIMSLAYCTDWLRI